MAAKSTLFKPKVFGGFVQCGARRRKRRPSRPKPPLSVKQVLAWADAHYKRTGKWPNRHSGPVYDTPSQTWNAVNYALRVGLRGLPGDTSLVRLLVEHRGMRSKGMLPKLTIKQILVWADAHHERTGAWPTRNSGPVHEEPAQSWVAVDTALNRGHRGLAGGTSLARLLVEQREIRRKCARPRLTIKQVLAWADAHYAQAGAWPNQGSGRVNGVPAETWGSGTRL